MTETAFRKLLSGYKIESYNRETLFNKEHYRPGNYTFNTFFPSKKQSEPRVKKVEMNVANIWLEHKDKRRVNSTTFDPTETNNKKFLNIWSGFAITEEEVRKCDDWTTCS